MIDVFLNIFYTTCAQLVPVIPAIVGVWLLFDLISSLIFRDR